MMGWKRGLKIAVGGLVALFAIGAGWTYYSKPWVYPVSIKDAGPTGTRIVTNGLFGNYFPSPDGKRAATILLVGGSEGGLGLHMTHFAKALQSAGYTVFHLSYWRGPSQPKRLEEIPIEYFEKALIWLKGQSAVDPERMAMAGWSRGSEATVLVAARNNGLKAIILGMPGSHVWPDFDWEAPWASKGTSGWSIDGKRLPAVSLENVPFTLDPATGAASALAETVKTPAAALPIAGVSIPVLMICGAKDNIWASCPMARSMKATANSAKKADVSLIEYSDAGHVAFGAPAERGGKLHKSFGNFGGGTADANQAALENAFPKMLSFLEKSFEAKQ